MSSTGSKLMVRCEECLEGNGGGDDFGVRKSLLGDIPEVMIGESGEGCGNGYPRKGKKSKPKRQNRAQERKDREKSKRQKVQVNKKSKSKSTPG
ncbi:hypothetical protein Tco_1516071 [Tanacetum coccineum]